MKTCTKCKVEQELDEFNKDAQKPDGKASKCKSCYKVYYKTNRASIIEKKKVYYKDNKESMNEKAKNYYEANKVSIIEQKRVYHKERRASDPAFRMVGNMRARMSSALNGKAKADRTMKLLGCTPDQLKAHLESQFTEGMAWNQRGLWSVDHRLPCAAFDLTKKKHQKYCFHWSNLQPLWTADNLAKSDSYDPEELEKYLQSELPNYE